MGVTLAQFDQLERAGTDDLGGQALVADFLYERPGNTSWNGNIAGKMAGDAITKRAVYLSTV